MDNVNQNVKVLKYMKMPLNGNVNHATALVPNVHVLKQHVVPNVQELSSYMKDNVSVLVQMVIIPTQKQTLVINVTVTVNNAKDLIMMIVPNVKSLFT
jgi:hypothetical protein